MHLTLDEGLSSPIGWMTNHPRILVPLFRHDSSLGATRASRKPDPRSSRRPRSPAVQARYRQTRDDSAAILRMTLARMAEHDAPFHPVTYAVWYEHLAGINPALSRRLNEQLQQTPRLSEADTLALYREHVADADAEATESIRHQMQDVMQDVVAAASESSANAKVYGVQLQSLSEVLDAAADDFSGEERQSIDLSERIGTLAQETQRMQSVMATLSDTVRDRTREVERLRNDLERARVEAVTDPLSGLLNRRGFDDALRALLALPPVNDRQHALLVFDIDHFKQVNDRFGHATGDLVIEGMGAILRRLTRHDGLTAARIGGEEFAVLMRSVRDEQPQELAEAVRTMTRRMQIRKRGTQQVVDTVTVSAGIAFGKAATDAERLLAAADQAMYRSKQAGRDRVSVAA
jgi:diguanylate cyclase